MSFVKRSGAHLECDGRPFRSLLVNAYYLQEEAARGRLDWVDETLTAATELGANIVRAWAFNDDPNKLDSGIQRGRLVYDEAGLIGLDRTLDRARAHGVKLLLPLVNHWNAYGGARQWLLWNGVGDAREGDPRFFTDERLREHYAAHVAHLLTRVNSVNGVRYCDDDTVLGWELMNEPRGRGLDRTGQQLAGWIAFAARVVKQLAPAQLVCAGDEGEEVSLDGYDVAFWKRAGALHLFSPDTGTSFTRNLQCPDVDLASCHFYPEKYGVAAGAEREAGCAWIEEHARIAAHAQKPLIVGELGLANRWVSWSRFGEGERRQIYTRWLEAAADAGVAAIGPWLLAYRERPDRWDDFTFYPGSDVARVMRRASYKFRGDSLVGRPTVSATR